VIDRKELAMTERAHDLSVVDDAATLLAIESIKQAGKFGGRLTEN
jgi:hypothetical protein